MRVKRAVPMRTPAREGHQSLRGQPPAHLCQHRRQRARRKAQVAGFGCLCGGDPGGEGRRQPDSQPGFLQRFADCGDARRQTGGGDAGFAGHGFGQRVVCGVDPPAGEHRGAARKTHLRRALHEQQFWRGAILRAMAKDDQRGRRDDRPAGGVVRYGGGGVCDHARTFAGR